MNIICRWNIVYFYNIQINYWQRFTIKIYLLQVLCDFICDGEGNNHKRGYKLFCVMKFRRNVYISLCFETSTELDYQITYWHKTVLSNYLLTQNWIIKLLIDTKLDYQITYWHKTGLSNYLLPHNKVYTLFLLESPPYWLLNTDYSIQLCLFFTPPYHNILICENTILGFLHICLVYCRLLISFTYHKG